MEFIIDNGINSVAIRFKRVQATSNTAVNSGMLAKCFDFSEKILEAALIFN
jgi:hypothetical protein